MNDPIELPAALADSEIARLLTGDKVVERLTGLAALFHPKAAAASHQVELRSCLAHADESVRRLAAIVFAKVGAGQTEALGRAVENGPSAQVRIAAATGLAALGATAAQSSGILCNAIMNDAAVRVHAAIALAKIGAQALPDIASAIAQPDAPPELFDAIALMGSAAASTTPILEHALPARPPESKVACLCALETLAGEAKRTEELVETIRTIAEGSTRAAALERFSRLRQPATGQAMLEFLEDEAPGVRAVAILACARVGTPASVAMPSLVKCLADESDDVKRAALVAIGSLGVASKETIAALAALCLTGAKGIRDAAIAISARIGGDKP